MQTPATTDPATFLRVMIHTQLRLGMITPGFAEQALTSVNLLVGQALLGQQLGALGQAATAPTSVVAPTLKTRPLGSAPWQQHDHFSNEGKPMALESAADRRARIECEQMYGPRKPLRGERREVA
jgi:hypothetical protein